MTSRYALFMIAGILVIAGLFIGTHSWSVESGTGNSTACGTAFSPDDFETGISDRLTGSDLASKCDERLGTMKIVSFGALGFAGLSLLLGIAIPDTPRRPTAT